VWTVSTNKGEWQEKLTARLHDCEEEEEEEEEAEEAWWSSR